MGRDHPDVVLTLQHIGQVLQQLGRNEEAMQYLEEALKIEESRDGADGVKSARILNIIGNIHLQRNNVEAMMRCFSKASRTFQSRTQSNETLVISGYNLYGLAKMHPECAATA